jgi:hypothetical protein
MSIQSTPSKRQKSRLYFKTPTQQRPSWFIWAVLIVAMAGTFHEFVIQREDGSYELSEERQEKRNKKMEDQDEAVQYALTAKTDGYYTCYSCGAQTTVFLRTGEVWKYGHTTMKKRYADSYLNFMNLEYLPQYEGTLTDCVKEEIRKIYNYPLLPENLARSFKLPRPPGNKQDN